MVSEYQHMKMRNKNRKKTLRISQSYQLQICLESMMNCKMGKKRETDRSYEEKTMQTY